jgi:hypothetical protein
MSLLGGCVILEDQAEQEMLELRLCETGTSHLMAIHKKILEWQAAHPNITWIGWGVVWVIVLLILFWPRKSG